MLFPFYLAFFPAIVTSRQTSDQMNEFQGRHGTIWERLLWSASNGTGKLSRDPFMEAAVQRLFTESLIPKIAAGEEILCTKLEPVWLFPIGPIEVKKKSFRGELTACNIHMHNLKTAKITDIIIQRNEELSTKAVKAIFHIPIMWMTGKYKMERGLFLGFIPARSSGHFNIDLKHVTVGVLASLKTENATSVVLDQFEIGIHWRGTTIKFDSQRRKWDQISDFLINKVPTTEEARRPVDFILSICSLTLGT